MARSLPATLLVGLVFGLGFSSLSVAATAGVPDAEQGFAASLFQTSFQVRGAVVLAIVTAVVDAGGASRLASAPATLAAHRPALGLITGIAAIGMLVALSELRRRPTRQAGLADDLKAADVRAVDLSVSRDDDHQGRSAPAGAVRAAATASGPRRSGG